MADVKTVLREMVIRIARQESNAKVRPLAKRVTELRETSRLQKKLIAELQEKISKMSGCVRP